MLSDSVLPAIKMLKGDKDTFNLSKTICLFGLPEASVNEMLEGFPNDFPEIKLGLRAKFPGIHVKLYGRGNNENELKEKVEKASSWVMQKIGKWVFSVDGASMETEVGNLLSKNNSTVAVAESCTGGLISHLLTNVSGSSDYFLFTGVTYSNQAKTDVLGVLPDTLAKHGAVSKETVKEMAAGARKLAGATYGIATSGIAGPTGGTKDKPVGTVCIGISSPTMTKAFQLCFSFGIRTMNKEIFAMAALDILRRELLGINQLLS
jgi:nicotinamide-nucleotide amidase